MEVESLPINSLVPSGLDDYHDDYEELERYLSGFKVDGEKLASLEEEIFGFFTKLDRPIAYEDLAFLKYRVEQVYRVNTKETSHLEHLSITKVPNSDNHLEVSSYGKSRIFLHLLFGEMEMTQFDVGHEIQMHFRIGQDRYDFYWSKKDAKLMIKEFKVLNKFHFEHLLTEEEKEILTHVCRGTRERWQVKIFCEKNKLTFRKGRSCMVRNLLDENLRHYKFTKEGLEMEYLFDERPVMRELFADVDADTYSNNPHLLQKYKKITDPLGCHHHYKELYHKGEVVFKSFTYIADSNQHLLRWDYGLNGREQTVSLQNLIHPIGYDETRVIINEIPKVWDKLSYAVPFFLRDTKNKHLWLCYATMKPLDSKYAASFTEGEEIVMEVGHLSKNGDLGYLHRTVIDPHTKRKITKNFQFDGEDKLVEMGPVGQPTFTNIYDNTQILETEDPNISFEFSYEFTRTHDNFMIQWGRELSRLVVSKLWGTGEEEKSIDNVTQYHYGDGQEVIYSNIDENNHHTVRKVNKDETKELMQGGKIGYKAARTANGAMCVVKLLIPDDAKVAWDKEKDKYRTDNAIVLSIKPVVYNKGGYYYIKDMEIGQCPVCMDSQATHIAFPCRHKLCGDCWNGVLTKQPNKSCPYCRSNVSKVEKLTGCEKYQDRPVEIKEAYSCIHTNSFIYRLSDYVSVNNFDGDLNKVCAAGIHYHDKEGDIFKWFEYLDIPAELLQEKIPWTNNGGVTGPTVQVDYAMERLLSMDGDEVDDDDKVLEEQIEEALDEKKAASVII